MKLIERLKALFRRTPDIDATAYDAARASEEYDSYWQFADGLDANAANSRDVRLKLIYRSRYEKISNGISDGILNTLTNDLVGQVPKVNMLRMQSLNPNFNDLVETRWAEWSRATGWPRKLWMLTHAKNQDGESFGVIRSNPGVNNPVPLDVRLYEAEQVATPDLAIPTANQVDGIRFDAFDNPTGYDLLRRHPGSAEGFSSFGEYDTIPAEFVLHHFHAHRPGQKRGVVEHASTLQLGAAARRFRTASLSTAEKQAYWTLFFESSFAPKSLHKVKPMTTYHPTQGMITALPNSVKPTQMKAEFPGPQYGEFTRHTTTEQARPHSMPYGKAGGDWSDYNFASGRLALLTYYDELDYQRYLLGLQVLDVLFRIWFDAAVIVYGWLGGNPELVGDQARRHSWNWPQHRTGDVQAQANADDKRLRNGSLSLPQLQIEQGFDPEDLANKAADYFGIEPEEYKALQLKALFSSGGPDEQAPEEPDQSGSPGEPVPINAILDGRLNGAPITSDD